MSDPQNLFEDVAKDASKQMVKKLKLKKLLPVVVIVLVVILLVLLVRMWTKKSEHMASFRDFPGQKMATAEMLERATTGLNMNSDPSLQDPYSKALLDLSSIENAWVTANWKYTG